MKFICMNGCGTMSQIAVSASTFGLLSRSVCFCSQKSKWSRDEKVLDLEMRHKRPDLKKKEKSQVDDHN